MTRWIGSLACALAVSLAAGGLAAAQSARAETVPATPQTEKAEGEKRLQRRHHRRDYRDRRYRHRHGYRHRDHWRYRDRWHHRSRWHDRSRHYRAPRCWTERRHDRYRGRPALVSLRICVDRYGRSYVDYRSRRLVYYISPRHYRPRRW
jgi:hypothetical protein